MEDKYVYVDDLITSQSRIGKSVKTLVDSNKTIYAPTKIKLQKLGDMLISQAAAIYGKIGIKLEYTISSSNDDKLVDGKYTEAQHAMYVLGQQFKQFQSIHFIDPNVELCREMLIKWFNKRIVHSNFKYNRAKIPEWIDWLIIACGYYCSIDEIGQLYVTVIDWLDKLSADPSPFPFPKEVSDITSNPSCLKSEAVIIESHIKGALYTSPEFVDKRTTILDKWRLLSGYSYTEMQRMSRIKI